jgi:fatty acid desaturase
MDRRPTAYLVKAFTMLGVLVAVWVLFAVVGTSWLQILVAAVLGIVLTQLAFLSHDAAHRQVFRSPRANEWMALLIGTGLGGISLSWWNSKHNMHHQAPNQIGKDPDIAPAVIHFYPADSMPRSALRRFLSGCQGRWFYPLLTLEALNLHVQGVQSLLAHSGTRHRRWELVLLSVRLGAYPGVLLIILPVGMAAVFLATQLAVTGVYLGCAFAVTHIGMPIVAPDAKIDFFRRQVLMSRNVRGGRIACALMGGLNYQIEHHLFPSMARSQLRPTSRVVRRFCEERSVPYSEMRVDRAWIAVARYLDDVGLVGAGRPSCPTAASLR